MLTWHKSSRERTGHAHRSTGTESECFDSACVTRRDTASAWPLKTASLRDGSNVARRKNMADTVAASFKDGPSRPVIMAAHTLATEGAAPLLPTCCNEALKIASRMRPSALCLTRVRAASTRQSSGSPAATACMLDS
jgi:hypothetical protein